MWKSRAATHAFQKDDNEIFDRKVLGGHYSGHFGNETVKVINQEDQKDHPVLNGVKPFESKKLYKAGELAKDTIVLQMGDNERCPSAIHLLVWVRCIYACHEATQKHCNQKSVR